MKKQIIFFVILSSLVLSGCKSTYITSRAVQGSANVETTTYADLVVSPTKIKYVYEPTSTIKRAGVDNIINAAVQSALEQCGNADVMVELNYVIEAKSIFLMKKVEKVTITGYPAVYKNFRSANMEGEKLTFEGNPIINLNTNQVKQVQVVNVVKEEIESPKSVDSPTEQDEYYIAYLFKTTAFNMQYKQEVEQSYNMSTINKLISDFSASELRKMSKGHSKAIKKYQVVYQDHE